MTERTTRAGQREMANPGRSVFGLLGDETQGCVGRSAGLKTRSGGDTQCRHRGLGGLGGGGGVSDVLHDFIVVTSYA